MTLPTPCFSSRFYQCFLFIAVLMLTACSGSSGTNSKPPTPISLINAPSATIESGKVRLDIEVEGSVAQIQWQVTPPSNSGKTSADIESANQSTAWVTPDAPGDWQFTVTVKGKLGEELSDSVDITLDNVTANIIGAPDFEVIGNKITLDVQVSGSVSEIQWQVTPPSDSDRSTADIKNANQPLASFAFDVEGTYIFEATVTGVLPNDKITEALSVTVTEITWPEQKAGLEDVPSTSRPQALATDQQQQPWLVTGKRVFVYRSAAWQEVGQFSDYLDNVGTSNGMAALALSNSDQPYVAYAKGSPIPNAIAVARFDTDANQWQAATTPLPTDSYECLPWLRLGFALSQTGTPYVVSHDKTNDCRLSVSRYVDEAWEAVGAPGFLRCADHDGDAFYFTFKLDANDTPYIACREYGNGLVVKRYNTANNQWENAGSPSVLSERRAPWAALTFDSHNAPYIAYQDEWFAPMTVQRLDINSQQWQLVGDAFSTPGTFDYTLALASDNTPYMALYSGYPTYAVEIWRFTKNGWRQINEHEAANDFFVDFGNTNPIGFTLVNDLPLTAFYSYDPGSSIIRQQHYRVE